MTKNIHSVYINDTVWHEAQRRYGERGISAAIERLFVLELGILMECRDCGARFSTYIWDKMADKRGKCIVCDKTDLKQII